MVLKMSNRILLTLFCFYFSTTTASVIRSSNDTVSNGAQTFSDHGDPNLVCRPTRWPDVLSFFLLNYISHAATLKTLPGESGAMTILNILAALFFPASGVFRGFDALWRRAKLASTDLEMAARAGALCTVVQWPPKSIKTTRSGQGRIPLQPVWSLLESNIHGSYELPEGYALAVVPSHSKFENDSTEKRKLWQKITDPFHPAKHGKTKISCSYNAVKILVALIQLLYAIATMYQSRGDQIDWYGYAAFGLTVAPYAWMSVVNLCANLVCPEYPSMYLVGSVAMQDAMIKLQQDNPHRDQSLNPFFDGVVGSLTNDSDQKMVGAIAKYAQDSFGRKRHPLWTRTKNFIRLIVLTGLAAAVPLIIIGWISKFQSGSHTTAAQQISITLWLLYGVYFGVISPLLMRAFEERPILNTWATSRRSKGARLFVLLTVLFGSCAVFGLIHVGQMIVAFGICIPAA